MKTTGELNNKWWYRLIKVAYIGCFLFALVAPVVGIFASYGPEYDNTKSYIKCANGKEFILSENGITLYSDFMWTTDEERARGLCFDGETDVTKDVYGQLRLRVLSTTANSGKYELISNYTSRNWTATVGFSLLSIFIAALVFELVRRIFYYIFLGSLKPKKYEGNHSG